MVAQKDVKQTKGELHNAKKDTERMTNLLDNCESVVEQYRQWWGYIEYDHLKVVELV